MEPEVTPAFPLRINTRKVPDALSGSLGDSLGTSFVLCVRNWKKTKNSGNKGERYTKNSHLSPKSNPAPLPILCTTGLNIQGAVRFKSTLHPLETKLVTR